MHLIAELSHESSAELRAAFAATRNDFLFYGLTQDCEGAAASAKSTVHRQKDKDVSVTLSFSSGLSVNLPVHDGAIILNLERFFTSSESDRLLLLNPPAFIDLVPAEEFLSAEQANAVAHCETTLPMQQAIQSQAQVEQLTGTQEFERAAQYQRELLAEQAQRKSILRTAELLIAATFVSLLGWALFTKQK